MAVSKEMTQGAPLPMLLRFSLPLVLGNMLQQTYAFADAVIVGRFLGIDALAAVGAGTSVIFLILGFCNGCCGGFGIPVAQRFGARDYRSMRRLVAVSLRLGGLISLFMALATSLLCPYILRWMQTPAGIQEDANIYLLITFIGIPCSFYYNLLSSIIRALGDSRTPFLFLLVSTVMNIVLDLLCILVLDWGVAGAALASVFSQGISALLCYRYMKLKYTVLQTEAEDRRLRGNLVRQLLGVGVPMGLQFSITAIGSIMLQSANNALGTACVAAYTAGIRIKMFFLCMMESLGVAMATYCGQNYGAGKPERIWQGVRAAGWMMGVFILLVNLVLWNFSEEITRLFVDASETEVIGKTSLFLHISVSFFPLLGILLILRYSIQGAGYTGLALFSGVAEMAARTLVGRIGVPRWGYHAVCLGDTVAWIFAVAFLIPAFIHVYHRLLEIVEKEKRI